MSKYLGHSKRCIAWTLFPNNRETPTKIINLMEQFGTFHAHGGKVYYDIADERPSVCENITEALKKQRLNPEPDFIFSEMGFQ
jgi:hypothetical protein